jgi:glycosyltransferase involved in cell wall biosynthesis
LGYVGRLTHLKGVDLLAAAFREVSQATPNARLLLVGAGDQESLIRQVLAREVADGTVHVEKDVNHEDLPAWYRAMDLFVMPSRYENHSNALLEAMGCGVPFLASDVGGNRKLSESRAGILFKSESIPSLIQELLHLVTNGGALKTLRDNSRRLVLNQHTWATSAEHLERIIERRLGVK